MFKIMHNWGEHCCLHCGTASPTSCDSVKASDSESYTLDYSVYPGTSNQRRLPRNSYPLWRHIGMECNWSQITWKQQLRRRRACAQLHAAFPSSRSRSYPVSFQQSPISLFKIDRICFLKSKKPEWYKLLNLTIDQKSISKNNYHFAQEFSKY